MSCDVGGHIGFSFTQEHRQNGEEEKRAVWTEQQEDMLMDLFEDNEGLYKTGEKAYSNRESNYAVLLRISQIFPGKTGKYLYYRPAAWRTLIVESVNLL